MHFFCKVTNYEFIGYEAMLVNFSVRFEDIVTNYPNSIAGWLHQKSEFHKQIFILLIILLNLHFNL